MGIKKFLFVICAVLVLPALGFAFCIGDHCYVPNPYQAAVGVDIKLDFDVCVDLPKELCPYEGCQQAVIVQAGTENTGGIVQTGKNFALIYQAGSHNEAYTTQSGSKNTALTFQFGMNNDAFITQSGVTGASAVISQWGCGNIGSISQY